MGSDVIDVEEGNMRVDSSTQNGDAEVSEVRKVNPSSTVVTVAQNDACIIEPRVGMEFESEGAAKAFYDEYARRVGFSTKLCQADRSRPDNSVMSKQFVCDKERIKKRPFDACEAMLKIELKDNKWTTSKFVKEHNHALESPHTVMITRPQKHFAGPVKNVADSVLPSGVMYASMDGNHGSHSSAELTRGARSISPVDSNRPVKGTNGLTYAAVTPCHQKRTFGKDAHDMLEYFKKMQAENPRFFYAIQLDDDNRMANVFWADARSRSAYGHFGDVVTLDSSFRVNQYKVPFASFSGVNHHGQPILFGCALLLDDSEASFIWLLKTFLTAMSDRTPVSIVTDQDRAIQTAVSKVLPKARHCISKWRVLREGQERLAPVCLAHPNFQVELSNCINLTETIEEFESCWASMIDKYDLSSNEWLQSIYGARRQWVPVYFRDSFFAAVSPNQGVECSFFEGHVNQETTLPMFFRQYERAMEYWFEKEIEADFDTISNTPLLKTPSPMEKQAANLYTRKIFAKFQEELVETFVYTANMIDSDDATTTYQVAKFEDDQKAYTVILYSSDCKASCSCLMFQYSGILCRHILTVFTVTNVLTLPSHYILKRWTRNAKIIALSDEHGTDHAQESMASRYNSLCREAIRYSEEGAISSETYTAALFALREVGKKIDGVKKHVSNIPLETPRVATTGHDDKKNSAANAPFLWPQQDELTRRFNLNDIATLPQPVHDVNLLRMAPTSLQRNSGPSDSMAVLPCLKSMTWVMENKNSAPVNRIAVINLKLQDYSKTPAVESEVKFQLSKLNLEPMLRSMANISEQLSAPANRVAVINLKLQDTETITGESEVKFQVSRDTLGAMLRSMAYIREQLSVVVQQQAEAPSKKQRK